MNAEVTNLLTAYLMGWKSIRDCAEWISGIDWDDSTLEAETKAAIGRMELLSTEVLEGLRPEAEFWKEAAELVASATGSLYTQAAASERFLTADCSCDTTWPIIPSVVGAEVSQPWSISLQLVSG